MKYFPLFLLILCVGCAAPPTPTKEPSDSAQIGAILTVTAPQAGNQTNPSGNPTLPPVPGGTTIPSKTLSVAHRGGAALQPENTLAAFENAIRIGADMVECDIHLSKDGEVVVMHDPDVSRTTDGAGQIGNLTLAEIKKLNAAAKFSGGKIPPQAVPTLAELLDMVKGKVGIQIEIKTAAGGARYPGIEKKMIDLINARAMVDQVLVISFDFPILREVKAMDRRFKTGALVQANWFSSRRDPQAAVEEIVQTTGADYFLPTAGSVTESLVQATHARGLKFGTWTVNTPGDMRRLAGWGVDAITSDNPEELVRQLGNR